MVSEDRKVDQALDQLLSRQNYLVTQANDLARAFGNLSVFEHKILDYCFSFVTKDDDSRKMYQVNLKDVLHHLDLNLSGENYKRTTNAIKSLHSKLSIYMRTTLRDGHEGILMTYLFDHVAISKAGTMEFRFSDDVAPYVFDLKKNFYSFHLAELSGVKSKYTLLLMKLWNANSVGKLSDACIKGSLAEWESWFLGSDNHGQPKEMVASRFKQEVINRALKELDRLYPETLFTLMTLKQGRQVIGYQLDIHPLHTHLKLRSATEA